MPIGAIIGGAATLGGALLSSNASKKAANAQVQSADKAIDFNKYMFDTNRTDTAPWRAAGGEAIQAGAGMLQPGYDHTTSPGYQFRLSEGLRGVEGSAAARGLLHSGGTLKGIMRYGQGVAADDFNDQFNRQMAVAAGGQQANALNANVGSNTAGNLSQLLTQQGNARASGYAGQANAWGGALNSLGNMFGNMGTPNWSGGIQF